MRKTGGSTPEGRIEKRVYEIKMQAAGVRFGNLDPEELDQLNIAAAHIFAGIMKTGEAEMVRDVGKKTVKYSVILDEAEPQAIEKARKALRSSRSEHIVLIDRGQPTAADYARHKEDPIFISTNLFTDEEGQL